LKWNCFLCNTDMEEKIVSTTTGWGEYTTTVDGIKAYVCPECNERIYTPQDIHRLQELGKNFVSFG